MKTIRNICPLLFLFLAVITLHAQDLPARPNPPRLVVDYTGILAPSEARALENKLIHFNDTTSNQILIVITDNLLGHTPETFASGIGDSWGVGQGDFDNGVVVLVKPKIGNNRGHAFISVGEYNSDEYATMRGNPWWVGIPFIVFFVVFVMIIRLSRRSRTIGSQKMSPWTAFWLGGMMGSSSGSSWGGSSGSSWGGGGSSFGGFGGGGFGGGGAGGSW